MAEGGNGRDTGNRERGERVSYTNKLREDQTGKTKVKPQRAAAPGRGRVGSARGPQQHLCSLGTQGSCTRRQPGPRRKQMTLGLWLACASSKWLGGFQLPATPTRTVRSTLACTGRRGGSWPGISHTALLLPPQLAPLTFGLWSPGCLLRCLGRSCFRTGSGSLLSAGGRQPGPWCWPGHGGHSEEGL